MSDRKPSAAEHPPHHSSRPTVPYRWRWLAWLLLTAVACAGFSRYRVDNDINAWYPQLAAHDANATWLILGFPNHTIDANALAVSLRKQNSLQYVIDPGAAEFAQHIGSRGLLDLVRSDDGAYLGMLCVAKPTISADTLVADVQQVLKHSLTAQQNAAVALGGPAVFVQTINHESQRGLPVLTMLGFGLATLSLRAFIGRWRPTLEAAAAVAIAQAVTLGTASWLGRPMDMASSMAPALLMAMGMSYALHRAMRINTTRGLLLAAFTTGLGLISFAATDVGPVRQFALLATVGLTVTFVAVLTLVQPPHSDRKTSTSLDPCIKQFRKMTKQPAGRSAILAISVAVSLAGLIALTQINLQSNPVEMFAPDHPLRQDLARIESHLTGMLPFQLVVKGQTADASDLFDAIDQGTLVRQVIRLPNLAPSTPDTHHAWAFANQDALDELQDAFDAWQTKAQQMELKLAFRGPAAQILRAQQSVTWVGRSAFLSMACVAALVVGFAARSVRWAMWSIWVNTLPVLGLAVGFWTLAIPIDLPSIMIGSIAVGIAMDDTVHMVLGMRRFQSTTSTLRELGPACLASSLVTAISLLPLTMAPFKPTAQFATMTAFAILIAVFADLLLIPTLHPAPPSR